MKLREPQGETGFIGSSLPSRRGRKLDWKTFMVMLSTAQCATVNTCRLPIRLPLQPEPIWPIRRKVSWLAGKPSSMPRRTMVDRPSLQVLSITATGSSPPPARLSAASEAAVAPSSSISWWSCASSAAEAWSW